VLEVAREVVEEQDAPGDDVDVREDRVERFEHLAVRRCTGGRRVSDAEQHVRIERGREEKHAPAMPITSLTSPLCFFS